MDIKTLIEALQTLTATVTVSNEPVSDFTEGDRVLVHHYRKEGSEIIVSGTVVEVCGYDDTGYYTRVEGDNGNHYRTGVKLNEERRGTSIIRVL